jgi:hypothetical protein
LYELIKKNNYQGFSLNLIQRFTKSLIQCLRLLHRENIIHCDLKPVSVFFFFSFLCMIMNNYLEPVARACAFLTKGSLAGAIGFA